MANRLRDTLWNRGSAVRQLVVLVAVVVLGTGAIFAVAAAGGIDDDDDTATSSTTTTPGSSGSAPGSTVAPSTTTTTNPIDVPGRTGGSVELAALRWPECLNPILSECSSEDFFHFTVGEQVLPKLMELGAEGDYVASPLLVETPTVANGGIEQDPLVITYRLNPDAQWDDGTPITSSDIVFTWQAILSTNDAANQDLYEGVEITDLDPHTVELRFRDPTSSWPELFGGTRGYVLEGSQFLNPDLADELETDVPFSGGPWILESWDTEEAVLVANPDYWDLDRIPRLDRVTFVRKERQGANPANVLVDGLDATFRPSVTRVLRPDDDVEVSLGRNSSYQAVWFNQKGLTADRRVRSALELIVPRAEILDDVVHPQFPEVPLLQCVGWVPTLGPWCNEGDYATFRFDPTEAAAVLDRAGYARGDDGVRVDEEGNRLSLRFTTLASDSMLLEVQELVRASALSVGIELTVDNAPTRESLEQRLARRDYDVALTSQTASPLPGVTDLFGCESIPNERNDFTGGNFTGWCNDAADALMADLDEAVDVTAQLGLVREIGDFEVSDHVALPLVQGASLVAWLPESLEGPIDRYLSSPYSPYWNVFAWSLPPEEPDG